MDNLAWRAAHTTGMLAHEGQATGVIYGVLRDIVNFQKFHTTEQIVFCFDHGYNLRIKAYEDYKLGRRIKRLQASKEEAQVYQAVQDQIRKLKIKILPKIGFVNVFYHEGYEADDIIASVCQNLPDGDTAVLIGTDKDLYQLLRPEVSIWNPVKYEFYTWQDFRKDWQLRPSKWKQVRAIAGCSTDEVKGIEGVGEKFAAKYLRGEMKPSSILYNKIQQGKDIKRRNLSLVSLPYEGCPDFIPMPQERIPRKRWDKVFAKFGIRSL